MIKELFARWFGTSAPAAPPTAPPRAAARQAPAASADGTVGAYRQTSQVSCLFYQWITGAEPGRAGAPPDVGKLILDKLARLADTPGAGADLVPRVPAVLPQLLRSLRDESVSGADLARQIAQDVVLVAEVIREANSPYYHPTAPVKTIEGAIMLLGQNGMRMLLARVSFRPIINMQSGHFAKLVAPHVWTQSEQCALAASILAGQMGANQFEAYLAGLMNNVGLIVAFRLTDQIYQGEALPQSEEFCLGLNAAASVLSARIAALWDFPASVAGAIEQLYHDKGNAGPLARTLALADRISKLRMLVDAGQLKVDDPFITEGLHSFALACFEKLHNEED